MAKLHRCDGCDKDRRDVISCGRDANGDPDAPDLCFICRKESTRGRVWDRTSVHYVNAQALWDLRHPNS